MPATRFFVSPWGTFGRGAPSLSRYGRPAPGSSAKPDSRDYPGASRPKPTVSRDYPGFRGPATTVGRDYPGVRVRLGGLDRGHQLGQGILRVAEEHHRLRPEHEVVLYAGKARPHRPLHEDDVLGLVGVQDRHAVDRAPRR